MATAQGIVRFRQQDHTVTFRVEGRGTMNQSLPLRRCAERYLEGGITHVLIDLRDCTYMDSTFLGTLLTLKKSLTLRQGEMTLIAPSPSCCRILQQMGLNEVLPTQAAEGEQSAGWTELGNEADPGSFKRNVVQAHEELANLPGPAGEQFKAVVRCMAQADKEKQANQPASPPKE
jgi:anti-anti-sigma factor